MAPWESGVPSNEPESGLKTTGLSNDTFTGRSSVDTSGICTSNSSVPSITLALCSSLYFAYATREIDHRKIKSGLKGAKSPVHLQGELMGHHHARHVQTRRLSQLNGICNQLQLLQMVGT